MPSREEFQQLIDQDRVQQGTPDYEPAVVPNDVQAARQFYNQFIAPPATATAVAGSVQDPAKTAKTLDLSDKTGINPVIVEADPDAAQQQHRAQQASQHVSSNPNLQSYVNENPHGSTVSNDDWHRLNELSQTISNSGIVDVPGVGPVLNDPQTAEKWLLGTPPGSWIAGFYNFAKTFMEHGYDKPPDKMSEEEFYLWNLKRQQTESMVGIFGGLLGLDPGMIGATGAAGLRFSSRAELDDFLARTGARPTKTRGQMWRDEIDEFLAKKGSRPPSSLPEIVIKPDEIPEPGEAEAKIAGLLPPPETTTVTNQMIRAGQIPPKGIDPLVDKFHQALIKHDLAAFDQIFQMVQQSDTYKKSPQMMSRFLQTVVKDATVGISNEAVNNLYADKVPGPEDGLLGFDPDIVRKLANSKYGPDVTVPMSTFLAHVDPSVYEKLRDDIRIRPDGLTRNESRELEPTDPESIPKTLLGAIRKSFYFQPMFIDNRPMNVPSGMYTKYFNKIVKEGQTRLDKTYKEHERIVKREMTPEWRANEKEMKEQAELDMRYDPGFRADRYLRMGELPNQQKVPKLKIQSAALERYIKAGQAPTVLRKYAHPNGELPDKIAQLLDFRSGAEMFNALGKFHRAKGDLQSREYFDQRVKDETAARMEARYGDLPTKIYEETRDRALAEEQIDVFIDELYMINAAGELGEMKPITKEDLKAWAKKNIMDSRAYEVNYADYQRAAEKAGRKALDKALSQKWGESFQAKQDQAINTYMAKEAIAWEKEADKLQTLINRYSYNTTVKGVKQEYVNYIHAIFDKVGLPQPRTTAELYNSLKVNGVMRPLTQFVQEKAAMGFDPAVDTELLSQGEYPFSEWTVQERMNFRTAIESLDKLGRYEATIKAGTEVIDFEVAKAQARANLQRTNAVVQSKDIRAPSVIQRALGLTRQIDAFLVKPEQRIDWYDRNDSLGPFNTIVFRPLADAKHMKDDLLKELGEKIKALPGWKELKRHHMDQIDNQILRDWRAAPSGGLRYMTRGDVLGVVLNMGNPSNFEKLTGEFQVPGSNTLFRWDRGEVNAFVREHADKATWDLAQGIWDIFEHYRPKMEDLAYRTSGVAPEWIEPRPIQTKFGIYKGGYYPLTVDPNWIGEHSRQDESVFGVDRWYRSTPSRNWEYARTDAQYPLEINVLAVIPKMEQFIHDIAYREALINAVRFVSDKDIRTDIQNAWGKEDEAQLLPWLQHVANGKVMNDRTIAGLNAVFHWTHDTVTATQLLYRMSTVVKHGIAAGINSGAEVGVGNLGAVMMRMYMSPEGPRMIQEILSLSGEMRNRVHDLDRDIGEQFRRAAGESGTYATFKLWGGAFVAAVDKFTAFPTWYVTFENAYLRQGMDKQEAIFVADKAVRNAHGASGLPDLARVQRGNELERLATVAYSFFGHSYNRLGNMPREIKFAIQDKRAEQREGARAQATARMWRRFFGVVLKFLLYTTVTGTAIHAVRQKWKKPGESGTHAFIRHTTTSTAEEVLGTLPYIREFSGALDYFWGDQATVDPMNTPFFEVAKNFVKVPADLYKDLTHQTKREHASDYIIALGQALQLPGAGQLASSAQYYFDKKEGIQPSEDIWDLTRGYAFGRARPGEPLKIPRGRSTTFRRY